MSMSVQQQCTYPLAVTPVAILLFVTNFYASAASVDVVQFELAKEMDEGAVAHAAQEQTSMAARFQPVTAGFPAGSCSKKISGVYVGLG